MAALAVDPYLGPGHLTGVITMSQSPGRPINRIPQIVMLLAAGALIVFLILLGTDTISPGDGPTMIISGSLFAIALIATAAEFEINGTGLNRKDTDE
jgi:small neutral amino acid transporter SnatA (MarC family)